MRISDWSSDVCSSDLLRFGETGPRSAQPPSASCKALSVASVLCSSKCSASCALSSGAFTASRSCVACASGFGGGGGGTLALSLSLPQPASSRIGINANVRMSDSLGGGLRYPNASGEPWSAQFPITPCDLMEVGRASCREKVCQEG